MFKWLRENSFVISIIALIISGTQCTSSCIKDFSEKTAKAYPRFSYDLVTRCPLWKVKYDYYKFELENKGERDRLVVKAISVRFKGKIIKELCKEIEPFDCETKETITTDTINITSEDDGIPPGEIYRFSVPVISDSQLISASFISTIGKKCIAIKNKSETWEQSGLLGQIEEKE